MTTAEIEQARDLHQALPRSDLHLVPNAGHMVTYADPAAIAEAVNSIATLKATSLPVSASNSPEQEHWICAKRTFRHRLG